MLTNIFVLCQQYFQNIQKYYEDVMAKMYSKGEKFVKLASPYVEKYYDEAEKQVSQMMDYLTGEYLCNYHNVSALI